MMDTCCPTLRHMVASVMGLGMYVPKAHYCTRACTHAVCIALVQ